MECLSAQLPLSPVGVLCISLPLPALVLVRVGVCLPHHTTAFNGSTPGRGGEGGGLGWLSSPCLSLKAGEQPREGRGGEGRGGGWSHSVRTRIASGLICAKDASVTSSVDGASHTPLTSAHACVVWCGVLDVRAQLLDWCKTAYSEVFGSWMHLVAVRLFVESILRYGLPPSFVPVVVKPHARTLAHPKALRGMLADQFGRSQVCVRHRQTRATDSLFLCALCADRPPLCDIG